MTDIVERLRRVAGIVVRSDDDFSEDYTLGRNAADEIEQLQAENKKLREALKMYAGYKASNGITYKPIDDNGAYARYTLEEKND